MCFSATGSFVLGAGLMTAGLFTTKKAWTQKRSYVPFGMLPLLFGAQQLAEGVIWLRITSEFPETARTPALVFMFFSHFFWLFWVPLAAAMAETVPWRRKLFFAVTVTGVLFGGAMYWPFVFDYSIWHARVVGHSIGYYVDLVFDDLIPRDLSHGYYAFLTLFPLLASSDHRVKILGALMAVSAALTLVFFVYTFSSVWCFFAAGLSLYVIYLLKSRKDARAVAEGASLSAV